MRWAANWSATSGRSVGVEQDVAARHVDLVRERQRHGVAGLRLFEVAVLRDDAPDDATSCRTPRR